MASKREAVVDAVVTALGQASVGGTTKPSGLTVHRMRKRPVQADSLPALVVYLMDEPVQYEASSRANRGLQLAVECRVSHPGTDGDTALDPLLVWAEKALMADITLDGAATNTAVVRTAWDLEDAAAQLAAAAIVFRIDYPTAFDDPESAG